MIKLKIFFIHILSFFTVNVIYSQANIKKHLSVKVGHSLSVTQWGLNPLSETRRLNDRSINGIFFNLQYAFEIKRKKFNIGLQLTQKGFLTNYERKRVYNDEVVYYEHRLFYLELPINYKIESKKNSFISGLIFSYLYDDIWRFSDVQTFYDKNGNVTSIYNSNYTKPFPYFDRYNVFDFGLNVGYARKINESLDFEFTIQKHFINVDNWHTEDLKYNLCFLTGLRYKPF